MIKSMTGYGCAKGNAAGFDVSVELKSVNNKYLETSVRLPRNFIFAEDLIKKTVQSHISRGKVDVFITVNSSEVNDVIVTINKSLLDGYVNAVKTISEECNLPFDLTSSVAARFPDVLTVERNDVDSELIATEIKGIVEEALIDFDNMRTREGEKLKEDILSKVTVIESMVSQIEKSSPETVEKYRERLINKMNEVLSDNNYDENRIIQEAAIFADHIAVDEETVRLRSHISQLRAMMSGESPIGRKADFLIQEFNREANTIGSKCQNSEIAHVVVDLKSEIEKIREQIQNVE